MLKFAEKIAKVVSLLIVNIIVCTFVGNLLIDVFLGFKIAYVIGALIASSAIAYVIMMFVDKLDTVSEEDEDL